jgi:hypothetical protein
MISINFDVIRRLAGAVVLHANRLIKSPAFSVAAFIATIRAICSLTAESRKHLNSFTLKLAGTTSSRMLAGEGKNSYCKPRNRPLLAAGADSSR